MSDGGSEPSRDPRWSGSITARDPDVGPDRPPAHDPARGPDRAHGRDGRRNGSPSGRHRAGGRRPVDQPPGGQRPVEGHSMEPGRADGLDRGDPRLDPGPARGTDPGGDPGWNGHPRPSRASGPSDAPGSRDPRASRDPRMAGGGDPRWDAGADSWPGQSRGPADETRLDLRVTGRPIPGRSRAADPYRNGAGPLGTAGADVRRDPGADPR